MKYGDTFYQRSIPEWETYNVDYNDIKRLIKVRTTRCPTQAKSIPGHGDGNETLQAFEGELYSELVGQHQRVDLFVKSKSGEITRRLNHLEKQIDQLERQNRLVDFTRISFRRLAKGSRVEEEVLRAGHDIQSLSRFVVAQRLAFQKLLKKYQRWTGSQKLAARFTKEVLGHHTSFINTDFEFLLHLWVEALEGVRAAFKSSQRAATSGRTSKHRRSSQSPTEHGLQKDNNRLGSSKVQETYSHNTTVAELHHICRNGTDVDFDTALAILPLGQDSGRALYWVHSDDIVELHVWLLQYMKIWRRNNSTLDSRLPSPRASRKGSVEGGAKAFDKDSNDLNELIVCDDLQCYVKQHVDEERENVHFITGAATIVRMASSGEAVVAVGPHSGETSAQGRSRGGMFYHTLKVKRKALSGLFDVEKVPSQSRRDSVEAPQCPDVLEEYQESAKDSESVRNWLRDHKEVQPLVKIQRKRTRYFGLEKDKMHGIWCSLDQAISMRKLNHGHVGDTCYTAEDIQNDEFEDFPYALLEVRWEGNGNTDIIRTLDEGHLTERVDGFVLETHAVFIICKPEGVTPPSWQSILKHDIRKLPFQRQKPRRRRSHTQHSSESANTRATSRSANSIFDNTSSNGLSKSAINSPSSSVPDLLESALLSAFNKKRQPSHRNHTLRESTNLSSRYWNEYDAPSDSDENSAYHIFIDPNVSTAFPGWCAITNAFHTLITKAKSSSEKVLSWLNPNPTDDHRPLLPKHNPDLSRASSHNSISSSVTSSTYKTLPSNRYPVKSHGNLLLRSCIASFLISYLMLFIAFILAAMGKPKATAAARREAVLGVVFSVLFTALGVGCAVARKERGGWWRWTGLGLLVAGITFGWAVLGVMVLRWWKM